MVSSPPEALRPLKATDILDAVLGTYAKNIGLFILLVCLVQIPYQILSGVLGIVLVPKVPSIAAHAKKLTVAQQHSLEHYLLGLAVMVAVLLVMTVVAVVPIEIAVMVRPITGRFTGRRAQVGESLRAGWRQPLSLLGLIAVYLAFTAATLLVLALVLTVIAAVAGKAALLLDLVIFVAVAVFFAIYFLRALLAVPAMVVERLAPLDAIRRAMALTNGDSGRVLGVAVMLWVVQIAASVLVGFIFSFLEGFAGSKGAGPSTVAIVGSVITGVLVAPVFGGGWTTLYLDLRVRREQLTSQQLEASLPG